MAAIDSAKVDPLRVAVDNLASVLLNRLQSNRTYYRIALTEAYGKSQKFDSNVDRKLTDDDSYVDLYHFAKMVRDTIDDGETKSAAQRVLDAIGRPACGFNFGSGVRCKV